MNSFIIALMIGYVVGFLFALLLSNLRGDSNDRAIEYSKWVESFENSEQAMMFHGVTTHKELYKIFLIEQSKS